MATNQSPESGKQLHNLERLREVILSAGVQTVDPVGRHPPGRQHKHRSSNALRPQTTNQVQTLDRRQAPINNHDVERRRQPQVQPALTVRGGHDRITLRHQQPRQQTRQLRVILDKQQRHHVTRTHQPTLCPCRRPYTAPG